MCVCVCVCVCACICVCVYVSTCVCNCPPSCLSVAANITNSFVIFVVFCFVDAVAVTNQRSEITTQRGVMIVYRFLQLE